MHRWILALCLLSITAVGANAAPPTETKPATAPATVTPAAPKVAAPTPAATAARLPELHWAINYGPARDEAEKQEKPLLIYFYDANSSGSAAQLAFERQVLADRTVRRMLDKYVLLLLPIDTVVYVNGRQRTRLLSDESFYFMRGMPGVAIVDLASRKQPYYGRVVSAFPFEEGHTYDAQKMRTILTLPPGTLTQRTLIYAVRMHPEHPASADGKVNVTLTSFAEEHSQYMAAVQVQGHQDWENRFHQLEARIPGDLTPSEVAAESWPGQSLVDAAEECVHSWRQSSGHWDAVRHRHPIFGFDMKLGRNGIWYATGIFGRRQ